MLDFQGIKNICRSIRKLFAAFNTYVFFKVSYVFQLILYDNDILLMKAFISVLCNDSVSSTY